MIDFAGCKGLSFCALFVFLLTPSAWAVSRHTPPSRPRVAPGIPQRFREDADGDRLDDTLMEKARLARLQARPEVRIPIILVFSEPVTQQQIDLFEALGGEITHLYGAVLYGWSGSVPLQKAIALPAALGATLRFVQEPKACELHMAHATQTGRIRAIWATNFMAGVGGYDGSTNITIGILDTGVDESHTDLNGRRVFWKDFSSDSNASPRDLDQHGSHVAGIAFGTGAASGTNAAGLSYTQEGNLNGAGAGIFYAGTIELPPSNITVTSGAKWLGGGTGTFDFDYSPKGSQVFVTFYATNGTGSASFANTFTPSANRVYMPALQQNASNTVKDFVVTNRISSYPAIGDGFAKMRGVAPGCNWAAAKVFTDTGANIDTWSIDALDEMVTNRLANNIKVINLSFGVSGTPGISTTLRAAVNSTVSNGIVVVVSAGNDMIYSSTSAQEIDDPGRAALALTVAAATSTNSLTYYTSAGFSGPDGTEDYKPDLMAPGGSSYNGMILSVDSNTRDGTGFVDQVANDYTMEEGTSMAAPFAAGASALVIDALQQGGLTWDFYTATNALFVKMVLSATATESNSGRETNTNNPTLQRASTGPSGFPAGKDPYEGYGMMNPDAAIEASVLGVSLNTALTNTLGTSYTDRRAWARKVTLTRGAKMSFTLNVPTNGDFDLYLYRTTPDVTGAPIMLTNSVSAGLNTDESFTLIPASNDTAFLVVKRVSGSGVFTQMVAESNDAFTNAWSLFGDLSGSISGDNTGYTTETGEPSHGSSGSGKSAWHKWISPFTGKASFRSSNSRIVAMYTGSAVSNLSATAAGQVCTGGCGSNDFAVTAGTSYWIAVDGISGGSGAYTLTWSCQQATYLVVSNSTALAGPTNGVGKFTSYPSTITLSNIPGSVLQTRVSLNNVMHDFLDDIDVLLVATNAASIRLMSDCGGTNSVTNVTITIDENAASFLPDTNTIATGTYKPTDYATSPAQTNDTFASPAPSAPYTNSLWDINGSSPNGTWSLYAYDDAGNATTGIVANGWTLILNINLDPYVFWGDSSIAYSENGGSNQLQSAALAFDDNSSVFSNGSLVVQLIANGATEDRLTVVHEGNSGGQIGVSGTNVSYGGAGFGTWAGGTNGATPLVITFTNSSATASAAGQLLTRIFYQDVSDDPSTNTRSVLFTLYDGDGGSVSYTETVTVAASNDYPTLTAISTFSATEDVALAISWTNLSAAANEADPDSTQILFRLENVVTGTLTKGGAPVTNGLTILSNSESFIWTAATNANGLAIPAFAVRAWDRLTNSIGAVTVKVDVAAVNDTPTISTLSTFSGATEDTAFAISYAALTNAGNEADVETFPVSFQLGTLLNGTLTKGGNPVTNGTTTLSNGESFAWTPALDTNGLALAAFTLKAWDGALASASAVTVRVDVAASNDAPTISTFTTLAGATEDVAFTISYSALTNAGDEADVDSAPVSFRLGTITTGTLTKGGSAVTNGATTLSNGESLVWTPATNLNGAFVNAFTLNAWDGTRSSTNAVQVTVNVTAVNDQPTLTTIATLGGATEDVAFAISYATLTNAADEFDVETFPTPFRIENVVTGTLTKGGGAVTGGVTTVTNGESLVWTAPTNANGSAMAAFLLKAWDGTTTSVNTVTARVDVAAVNDAPTIIAVPNIGGLEDDVNPISYSSIADYANDVETTVMIRIETVLTGTLTKAGSPVTNGVTTLAFGESLDWVPPTNAEGVVTVMTVRAWDGSLASTAVVPVAMNLAPINDQPVLANPISDQNATYGGTILFTFPTNTFTDVDAGNVFTYTATGMPPNIAFDAASRSFTGTAVQAGTFGVALYAVDNGAPPLTNSDLFNLIVAYASLTVTPANASRTFGETNPVFSGTLTGVTNNDPITATYGAAADTNSAPGTYPITATLIDPSNRLPNYVVTSATGTLTVIPANLSPTVSITSPTNTYVFNAGAKVSITATASDSDGTVTGLAFFADATQIGAGTSSPCVVVWTNSMGGTFSLTALAGDDSGAISTSAAVNVTAEINIGTLRRATSAQFEILFVGESGTNYAAQRSSSLTNWVSFTNFTVTTGAVLIADPTAGTASSAFYRVITP